LLEHAFETNGASQPTEARTGGGAMTTLTLSPTRATVTVRPRSGRSTGRPTGRLGGRPSNPPRASLATPLGRPAAQPRPVVATVAAQRPLAPAIARPTRLTVRGRRLLALLFVAMVSMGVVVGQASVQVPAEGGGAVSVVVQPGDTLWGIAAERVPSADPRVVVQRLVSMNGLANPNDITAGDELSVPANG
jgi:hypothetical protein